MTEVELANPNLRRRRLGRFARSAFVTTMGRSSSRLRPLPDFVILGAQRCGTTTLWKWLLRHPSLIPPVLGMKGIHYFDLSGAKSEAWYRGHFPSDLRRSFVARRTGAVATGEASPYYLFHPGVPARLGALLTETRFVVLLRDPVQRAASHYHHMRVEGHEPASTFEEALDLEQPRLAGVEQRLLADPGVVSHHHLHHAYVGRGHYAEQLQRLFQHVDRDRVLVLGSAELFSDPGPVYGRILDFIGLARDEISITDKAHNAGSYGDIRPATSHRLQEHFRPHDVALTKLLGERLW